MHLSSLYRFPLKSAAGESLQRCASDSLGLIGDRRWMVVAAGTGRFLTQRAVPRMALLRAHWQGDTALQLAAPGMPELLVSVPGDQLMRCVQVWNNHPVVPDAGEAAAAWLSEFLGQACRLVYLWGGFMFGTGGGSRWEEPGQAGRTLEPRRGAGRRGWPTGGPVPNRRQTKTARPNERARNLAGSLASGH